jgi:NUMOD4 motif-containing protein/HNH endonuclease
VGTIKGGGTVTVSEVRTETWKQVPRFPAYEASDLGHVRAASTGRLLALRPNNRGYLLVDLRADGKKVTRTVHGVVLETFAGPCPPGHEACHGKGGQRDNRYPENLRWDTKKANLDDWKRDNPPRPKEPKLCARCGAEFTGNGRRCHLCVVDIGVKAAGMLRSGTTLEKVAAQLEYPSLDGLHTLARKYGGYGQPLLRRVRTRLRSWFAGGDAP